MFYIKMILGFSLINMLNVSPYPEVTHCNIKCKLNKDGYLGYKNCLFDDDACFNNGYYIKKCISVGSQIHCNRKSVHNIIPMYGLEAFTLVYDDSKLWSVECTLSYYSGSFVVYPNKALIFYQGSTDTLNTLFYDFLSVGTDLVGFGVGFGSRRIEKIISMFSCEYFCYTSVKLGSNITRGYCGVGLRGILDLEQDEAKYLDISVIPEPAIDPIHQTASGAFHKSICFSAPVGISLILSRILTDNIISVSYLFCALDIPIHTTLYSYVKVSEIARSTFYVLNNTTYAFLQKKGIFFFAKTRLTFIVEGGSFSLALGAVLRNNSGFRIRTGTAEDTIYGNQYTFFVNKLNYIFATISYEIKSR